MQVLSQLSYNPTSVHSSALLSDAIPAGVTGCSAGEFGAPRIAGLHPPGSLRIEADALLLPRHRVRAGVYQPGWEFPT
jgi:hypothetical protein